MSEHLQEVTKRAPRWLPWGAGLAALALAVGLVVIDMRDESSPTSEPTDSTTTTAPSAAGPALFGNCDDPAGDGQGSGDLIGARISTQRDGLIVTWITAKAPPPMSDYAYFVNLSGAGKQIGLKVIQGGDEPAQFVLDVGSGRQQDFTGAYRLDVDTASLVVPLSALSDLAPPVEYSAVYAIDGEDVDTCEGTLLAPVE